MKSIGPATSFSSQNLDLLQRQLEFWRTQHGPWARLPQSAWNAAATLARALGPSLVSRRLRLSYGKLRQLASPTPALAVAPDKTRFVEVALDPWPASSEQPGYRAELQGGKLTFQLGSDLSAVLALAEAFWRRPG